jgi:hypothetical protein
MLELNTSQIVSLVKPQRKALVDSMPLVQSVFLSPETHYAHGNIVAFARASHRDSMKHVLHALALQLAALTNKRVLIAEFASLQCLQKDDCGEIPEFCTRTDNPNVWILNEEDETFETKSSAAAETDEVDSIFNRSWEVNRDFGRGLLEELRQKFDFILISCERRHEAEIAAPIVDGTVIVVAANRTRREQIRRTQQAILKTGGKLLGFVLDRHRPTLPAWLDDRL